MKGWEGWEEVVRYICYPNTLYTTVYKLKFIQQKRNIKRFNLKYILAKHFIFVTSGNYIERSSEVKESFAEARKNLGCDVSTFLILIEGDSKYCPQNFVCYFQKRSIKRLFFLFYTQNFIADTGIAMYKILRKSSK